MLDRSHRFHGRTSLNYVYRQGRTVRDKLLILKFAPNSHRQTYRAAVVVGKKVHKSAAVRNRLRRRIYEALRVILPSDTPSYDFVFTAVSDQLVDLGAPELLEKLIALLKLSGVKTTTTEVSEHAIVKRKEKRCLRR